MTTNENTSFNATNFLDKYKEEIVRLLDKEKLAQEANKRQDLPPVSMDIYCLEALAMIMLIQGAIAAVPELADDEFVKMGIRAARRLQENLFTQDSETYKALEFNWNPVEYLATSAPNLFAAMMGDISQEKVEGERGGGYGEELGLTPEMLSDFTEGIKDL